MKRSAIFFITLISVSVIVSRCKKNSDIQVNEVITNLQLNTASLVADGSGLLQISCELNPDATDDRREILFKTTKGQFLPNKDTTVIVKTQFINQKLVALATIQVPQSQGNIRISAQPNLPSDKNNDFILRDSFFLPKSVPVTLNISSNTIGIGSNYVSEATLVSTLRNLSGGKASIGNRVLFEDFLNGAPAKGYFKYLNENSNSDSQISAAYGIGTAVVGSKILIRCTLLDSLGLKTAIEDSIFLFINE